MLPAETAAALVAELDNLVGWTQRTGSSSAAWTINSHGSWALTLEVFKAQPNEAMADPV